MVAIQCGAIARARGTTPAPHLDNVKCSSTTTTGSRPNTRRPWGGQWERAARDEATVAEHGQAAAHRRIGRIGPGFRGAKVTVRTQQQGEFAGGHGGRNGS